MVVSMVKDSRTFAKMRVGASDVRTGAEVLRMRTYAFHSKRLEARRAFMEKRNAAILAGQLRRLKRREFFEKHSVSQLENKLAEKPINKLTVDEKRFVNTAFGINAKFMTRNYMRSFMNARGRFPTLNMKKRYEKLGAQELRAYELGQRKVEQRAFTANKFEILPIYHAVNVPQYCCSGDPALGYYAACPHTMNKYASSSGKIRESSFEDVKQNFVYKSKQNIKAHPYYGLSVNRRLHRATYLGDHSQVNLLLRLRNKYDELNIHHQIRYTRAFKALAHLNEWEVCQYIIDNFERNQPILRKATPQMENDGAHGDGSVGTTKTHNVVLTESRELVSANIPRIPRWTRLNTEDTVGSYDEMVDRWCVLDTLKWSGSTKSGDRLKRYHLPNYILTQSKFKDLISLRPFFNHRLWCGDLEIRIELNSNKFQIGQLQCSFYYGLMDMVQRDYYSNVTTLSQCTHGLLDAGGSNSIILTIPFRYHSPMLCLLQCGDALPAYLGTLNIYVLNKLRYVEGNPDSADININFRFKNNSFSGQISSSLFKINAIPEMEAVTVMAAMKLLDTVASDPNRDNPPYVAQPNYVVQQSISNMAVATNGAEQLTMLRFDGGAQTHHPVASSIDDHNTVYDVTRVFAYWQTKEWPRTQSAHSSLMKLNVDPTEFDIPLKDAGFLQDGSASPLTIMSNMFMQWRGSLELRFDIIAGQFHTGKLLVAFIPMHTGGVDVVTFDAAISSYNMQFDLQEARSFTFVIPYVSHDVWIRRRNHMDGNSTDYSKTGDVYVYVLNALNCPDTVSTTVDINLYIRAGETFELAVPIQPSIGLGFNRDYIPDKDNLLISAEGMDDAFLGTWAGYWDLAIFARWGTLAGRVVEFREADQIKTRDYYYYFRANANFRIVAEFSNTPGRQAERFFEIFQVANIGGYWVAIPFTNAANAMSWQKSWWANPKPGNTTAQAFMPMLNGTGAGISENPFIGKKMTLQLVFGDPVTPAPAPEPKSGSELSVKTSWFGRAEGERDNAELLIDPSNSFFGTGSGKYLFGESFNRLKDLCRRYQFYGSINLDSNTHLHSDYHVISFPTIPGGIGLNLAAGDNPIANKCRDGIIPIILSAFKFYRGSIRFKVTIHARNHGNIWLQHRPDMFDEQTISVVYNDKRYDPRDKVPVYAHGYASHIQNTVNNSAFQFEVPFYQTGMYGLLVKPVAQYNRMYSGNGMIMMGIHFGIKPAEVRVFYSLADDFAFSLFQGFPTMVDPTEIKIPRGEIKAVPQMDFIRSNIIDYNKLSDAITASAKSILNEAKDAATEIAERAAVPEGASFWGKCKHFFIFLTTQIAQMFYNFSIHSVVIAIVGLFAYLGVTIHDKVMAVARFIKLVFRHFFPDQSELLNERELGWVDWAKNGFKTPPKPEEKKLVEKILENFWNSKATAQSDGDEDRETVAGWFSLIFTGITSLVGCHSRGFKFDYKKASEDFLSAKHLRSGSTVFNFVKLNFKVLRKMFSYLSSKLDPTYSIEKFYINPRGASKIWFDECRSIMSIDLGDTDSFNPMLPDRVEACIVAGEMLMEGLIQSSVKEQITLLNYFERKHKSILEIRDKLKRRGKYAFKRVKPLHIQICGAPGIGKSKLSDELSDYVLKNVCRLSSIPINKECTVKASSKFWDQCTGNEPVVLLDDLWCVKTPDILSAQITNYIELYGDTIFSPPKAAVEDKDMRYAPNLIMSTTNFPWVDLPNVNHEAIWRRMDILIEGVAAPLDPENNPDCPHCAGEKLGSVSHMYLNDFHHMQFRIGDPLKANTYITGFLTYKKLLSYIKRELTPIFEKNRDAYDYSVRKALRNAERAMEDEEYAAGGEATPVMTLEERMSAVTQYFISEHEKSYRTLMKDFSSVRSELKQRMSKMGSMFTRQINRVVERYDGDLADAEMERETQTSESFLITTPPMREDEGGLPAGIQLHLHNELQHEPIPQCVHPYVTQLAQKRATAAANGRTLPLLKFNDVFKRAYSEQVVFKCLHLHAKCLEGHFAEEQFMDVNSQPVKCPGGCILKSPKWYVAYCKFWLNIKPSRAILWRRNQEAFLPPPLRHSKEYAERTMAQKIKDAFLDFVARMRDSESLICRTLRMISNGVKWVCAKFLEWLPIVSAVVGIFGVCWGVKKTWDVGSQSRTRYYQNIEIARELGQNNPTYQSLSPEEQEKWCVDYSIMAESKYWRDRNGIELTPDLKSRLYIPEHPDGLPAFPQANHYAPELPRVPHAAPTRKPPGRMQQGSQQSSVVEKLVRKNTLWIEMEYISGDGRMCSRKFMCPCLRAREVLVIRHYWETWRATKNPVFYYRFVENPERLGPTGEKGILFNPLDCKIESLSYEDGDGSIPNCNWMIMEMSGSFPMCKDITKFFASQHQHGYVHGNILFVRPGESSHLLPVIKNSRSITMEAVKGGQDLELLDSYLYDRHAPGYCGSAILASNLQNPIIGFHVAEWNNRGCAEPVYKETFCVMPTKKRPIVDIAEMELLDVELSNIKIDSVIYPKGVVPHILAANQAGETQYEKSPIHGEVMEVLTKPMPLKPQRLEDGTVYNDPLKSGCEKHGKLTIDFPRKIVEEARIDLAEKIINYCKPVRQRIGVLSLQQAVCGDPLVSTFTPLKWTSSEGFPLTVERPADVHGKAYLFKLEEHDSDDGYTLMGFHPELKRIYSHEMVMRKNGIKPTTVYTNCTKDELRPIEKADTPGKTRVFSTSPVQYIIAYRQYFADFNSAYRENRIRSEHGIGINVDSAEWGELARYITAKGPKIIAGDYSAFGDSLNGNVMMAAFEIIEDWYTHYGEDNVEEDSIVRGVLAAEAMNVKRLAKNLIYECPGGIASGFPATDLMNSMVNCLYIRIAWLMITNKSMVDFNQNCNLITYGDDLLINVTDEYAGIFNTQTLCDFFAQHNIKFTDCDKGDTIVPYRNIHTAPFLKRNFVPHPTRPGQYLAKIDEISIGSCLNWVISKDDPIEAIEINCLAALNLAYGWGPEYYNELRSKLKRIMSEKYSILLPAKYWHDIDNRAYPNAN